MKKKIQGLIIKIRDKKLLKNLDDNHYSLIKDVKKHKLTYLSDARLANIIYCLNDIRANKKEGLIIEAGCALGGSSILISKVKNKEDAFKVYDVFDMIPPPTEEDGIEVHKRYKNISEGKSTGLGGDLYYGYEDNLFNKVVTNFKKFKIDLELNKIQLIKGLVQETLKVENPVVFVHIDVDWYDPVKVSLERTWPYLVQGGHIILDDYFDWGGCKKATDEFLLNKSDYLLNKEYGSLRITKI